MMTAALHGPKAVRLKAQPNLECAPRHLAGRKLVMVKDPIRLRYFHLEEAQHFVLTQMDGQRTLEEIRQAYEQAFSPQRLTPDEIQAFASHLLQLGLVHSAQRAAGQRLFDRHQKELESTRWAKVLNPFYFKIPLVEPGRWLDMLAGLGRLLFHPLTVVLVFGFLAAALGLILTHWNQVVERLAFTDIFGWQSVVYLWAAVGIVKILHELGHALCCRRLGAEVHELGVVFLFFFPTLYCNVSDSWTVPDKRKRMAIAAAGVYVELLIASVAVFLWWISAPATFVHQFCLSLFLVCTVHTLIFNANPLLRSDGYFILSDWLEIPNLAQTAQVRLRAAVSRWFGLPTSPDACPASSRFLVTYALLSLVYRWLVVGALLWAFYQFALHHHMKWFGVSLVVSALVLLCARPLQQLGGFVRALARAPKISRVWLAAGIVLCLVGAATLVPYSQHVHGTGIVQVEPEFQQRLTVPRPGGFLHEVHVRDGQQVRAGDVLAVFRNPDLETRLLLNEAEQRLRGEHQRGLAVHLASMNVLATGTESYQEIGQHLQALAQQHASLKAQWQALTLRAPCDGTVSGFSSWEMQGKWLEEGTPLATIGAADKQRVVVLVKAADRQLLAQGNKARFRLARGVEVLGGEVTGIAQVDAETIPAQLAASIEGDVASKHDPVAKVERPFQQHFLVTIGLPDGTAQVGSLGQVRIEAGTATLWQRMRRWLGETFSLGL